MVRSRHHTVFRRCLRRPSIVWRGCHRAHARGCRLSCGYRSAARLARRLPRFPQAGSSTAVLRHCSGVHGLNGEQVHSQPPAAFRGCLQPRRTARLPPGISHYSLHADTEEALSRRASGARRHRSINAPPLPLRLLAGQAAQMYSLRLGRRHYYIWYGRETNRGNSAKTRPARQPRQPARHTADSLSVKERGHTGRHHSRRHSAALPCRMSERQESPCRKLPPHRRGGQQRSCPTAAASGRRDLHGGQSPRNSTLRLPCLTRVCPIPSTRTSVFRLTK